MDYNKFIILSNKYKSLKKYIKYETFLNSSTNEKNSSSKIVIYKTIFNKYIVTEWIDVEYGAYKSRTKFKCKSEAINFAWDLFGGDDYLNELIEKQEISNL